MRSVAHFRALAVGLAVVLAGCVAGEANPAAGPVNQPAQPVADAETGAVSVLVTDDALAPLAGAVVGLLETRDEAVTDASGRAAFNDLAPGTYTVVAQQLGYESAARKTEVAAGVVAEVVFALAPIPVVEAYHTVLIFKGYITCGAGLLVVRLVTVCGTTGYETPVGTYNVTVDPNHKDEFKQEAHPGILMVVGELEWSSSAPLSAQEFTLALYQGWICTPFCSSDFNYGGETGGSPVVLRSEDLDGVKDQPVTISHIVGVPGSSADPPFVIFIVQQAYTIYSSHFFGELAPEDYAARPDA